MPPSFSEEKDKQHDPVGVLVAFVVFIRHRFWAQMSLEWESFRCRIYQNFAPMVGFVWPLTLPFCYKISGPPTCSSPMALDSYHPGHPLNHSLPCLPLSCHSMQLTW